MHPTTKPLDLIRRLILNSTRIGDVVFDGFLGSGTTLLACEQTKRICIGVELDPEYCQTIIARFEKLSGIKAKRYEQG
jgi:DNA modification methylase